jgi:hypothetical protein
VAPPGPGGEVSLEDSAPLASGFNSGLIAFEGNGRVRKGAVTLEEAVAGVVSAVHVRVKR